MGRQPRPLPEGAIDRLRAAIRKARTKDQYRRVLAVWLRASLGLDSRQIAVALEWHPEYVKKFQSRYFREGEAVFRGKGRGGNRRPTPLLRAQASALLNDLAYFHEKHGLRLTLRAIQAECGAALGHPISTLTVYRTIRRQGWRAAALTRELPRAVRVALSPEGAQLPGAWEVLHNLLLKDFPVP
jgi:transposase